MEDDMDEDLIENMSEGYFAEILEAYGINNDIKVEPIETQDHQVSLSQTVPLLEGIRIKEEVFYAEDPTDGLIAAAAQHYANKNYGLLTVPQAIVTSSSVTSDCGSQTGLMECIKCVGRASILTNNQGSQSSKIILKADKGVQTTKNIDGLEIAIGSMKELSQHQLTAIEVFKTAMNIKDKNTGCSQHQNVIQQPTVQQAYNEASLWYNQVSERSGFQPKYANPSPPPNNNEIKEVPFGDEDFAPFRYQSSDNPSSNRQDLRRNREHPNSRNGNPKSGRGRGRFFYV